MSTAPFFAYGATPFPGTVARKAGNPFPIPANDLTALQLVHRHLGIGARAPGRGLSRGQSAQSPDHRRHPDLFPRRDFLPFGSGGNWRVLAPFSFSHRAPHVCQDRPRDLVKSLPSVVFVHAPSWLPRGDFNVTTGALTCPSTILATLSMGAR